MDTPDSAPNASLRLKRYLIAAGLRSYNLTPTRRGVNFVGRSREWTYSIGLTPQWLNVTTYVCELPKEPGVRARLLDWAMHVNPRVALVTFGISETNFVLELDYRAEHVDDTVLANLIGLMHAVAEERYPQLFRIVNGDDVLDSLGRTLEEGAVS